MIYIYTYIIYKYINLYCICFLNSLHAKTFNGFQSLLEVSFPVPSVSIQSRDESCHAHMHKTELASSDSNVDHLWPKPRSEHAALETAQNRSKSVFGDAH